MRYRLRYQQHDLELPPGQFLIGRSSECQLSLDDPLVSRKHAKLLVTDEGVFLEDLGSRNGVLLDAVRIEGRRKVKHLQKITIGSQDMVVVDSSERAADSSPAAVTGFHQMPPSLTMTAVPSSRVAAPASMPDESSKRADAFKVLGGVADKALALGRADEAERILRSVLDQIIQSLRNGRVGSPDTTDQACRYAVRLAAATNRGIWVDYVIEAYTHEHRIIPAPIVDELYNVLRKVDNVSLTQIRQYVEMLRDNSGVYGPAERFLLQRIEGLERLAALK